MNERDIPRHIAVVASAISPGTEPTAAEIQALVASGLALLEGFLRDTHLIAEATSDLAIELAARKRTAG